MFNFNWSVSGGPAVYVLWLWSGKVWEPPCDNGWAQKKMRALLHSSDSAANWNNRSTQLPLWWREAVADVHELARLMFNLQLPPAVSACTRAHPVCNVLLIKRDPPDNRIVFAVHSLAMERNAKPPCNESGRLKLAPATSLRSPVTFSWSHSADGAHCPEITEAQRHECKVTIETFSPGQIYLMDI